MDTNFCNNINIHKRIINCISPIEGKIYIFMNIYFLETEFSKGDQVTWSINGIRNIGEISSFKDDETVTVVDDETEKSITLPLNNINTVHPIHSTIMKMEENLSDEEDIFDEIEEEDIKQLCGFLDCKKSDIKKLLFPEGYKSVFIYEDMINEDDTNEIVLIKISQYCLRSETTPYKKILAVYEDSNDGRNKAVGFSYDDHTILSIDEIISLETCDLISSSERFTDINGDNHISLNDSLLELFENNNIKNNTLYFLSIDQYIEEKDIRDELLSNDLECDEISEEIKLFKNRIINKYWPYNKNDTLEKVLKTDKTKEYIDQKIQLRNYSNGNKFIYSELLNYINPKDEHKIEEGCDFFELDYFRIIRKDTRLNVVNLYKLFSEWKLESNLPFVKWVGSTYDNIFYKMYRDSMIYEGFDAFRTKDTIINFDLCTSWVGNLYRSNNIININQYEILHKNDVIIFKVCNEGDKREYCSFVIHQSGDIEFIIKKDKYDIVSISKRETIHELFAACNSLIYKINQMNIYSTYDIIDFGDKDEINKLFINEKETENQIDFIDYNIYFETNKYEVKDGITLQQQKTFMEDDSYNPNTRPFIKGSKSGFYLPLLKNIMKNLPMFFRYMIENNKDGEGVISGHYKRVNNYANRSTIQSAISSYVSIGDLEVEEIVNIISSEFNKDPKDIMEEYESWEIMMKEKRDKGDIRVNTVIEENGPDIIIREKEDYLQFEIKDSKSFRELERVIIVIKTMMNMIYDYVNGNDRFDHEILGSYLEGSLIKLEDIDDELVSKESSAPTFDDLFAVGDDTDDDDSEEEGENYLSDSDSDDEDEQEGGGGKYEVRSYALKRLKKYDKDLFDFQSERYQVNKKGKTTATRYGYAKVCQASKGLGSRQPIAVTSDELERINNSEELGSGKESYYRPLRVEGREEINGKEIHYICPQFWDVSKQLSIRKDVALKMDPDTIIPETLPRDGRSDSFILKRKGTYWDGIPEEESYKYFVPKIMPDRSIHPDGYGLPCCYSGVRKEKEDKPPPPPPQTKDIGKIEYPSLYNPDKFICETINTKTSGQLQPGKCSQLPKELQKMLNQNDIFKLDKDLDISKGFIRKGVVQNNGEYIFDESSFINSYIEIIDYPKDSETFIEEEIIKVLENDLQLFENCSIIHKEFKIESINKEDIKYVIQILEKNEGYSDSMKEYLSEIISENEAPYDLLFETNNENYIFNLVLSLKSYVGFLRSKEEKDDTFLIPVLNNLNDEDESMNIIIFELVDDIIKMKITEYTDTDNICFIYKDKQYYEPIIYRVNSYSLITNKKDIFKNRIIMDIKTFNKKYFEELGYIYNNITFVHHLLQPYPRGRMRDLTSTRIQKLSDCPSELDEICSEWLSYEDYIQLIKPELVKGIDIRWQENVTPECDNSGEKVYSKIKEIKNGFVIPDDSDKEYKPEELYYKADNKIIDPKLIEKISKEDWAWIDESCSDSIKDKDIDALIRREIDPEGDKLLLEYSTLRRNKKLETEDKKLKRALQSEFCHILKIIDDMNDIINSNKQSKLDSIIIELEKKNYILDGFYLNRYSEVSYLLYNNNGSKGILPIQPNIVTKKYREVSKYYDLNSRYIPSVETAIKDLQIFKKGIANIIVKPIDLEKSTILSISLVDGTYLPVKGEIISRGNKLYNDYEIIQSNSNFKEIDDSLYKINYDTNKDEMDTFIYDFNYDNKLLQVIFNHMINLVNRNEREIKLVNNNTNIKLNDKLYFTIKENNINVITDNEYKLLTYKLVYNIKLDNEYSYKEDEIPYFGEVTNINDSKININVRLNDKIGIIAKDNIIRFHDKKEILMNLLFNSDIIIPDNIYINRDDIFKIVNDDEFSKLKLDELIEYTDESNMVVKGVLNKNKSKYTSKVLIGETKYSKEIENIMMKYINKLIIIIMNGNSIKDMNKTLFENTVKLSYIEKIIPKEELFFRYTRNKNKMNERLRIIFKKNSDFIKTIDEGSLQVDKKIITRKLDKIPYYINKLYGESSFVAFSINSIRDNGSDWFNMTESLKAVNIRGLEYINPKRENRPDVINMIIDGLNDVEKENKKRILDDYNKYEKIKGKVLNIKEPYQYADFDDIKKRIFSKPGQLRFQIPDIQMLLNTVSKKYEIDLGIIFITYNYQKGSDIYFFHTEKLFKDTKILSFYHTIYNNDYILSNIISDDKLVMTVSGLQGINDKHNIWLKHKDGHTIEQRPCNKRKEELSRLREERKLKEKELSELNDEIDKVNNEECDM